MTPRRTAEERIVERSAKARLEPNDFGVGASAIWIASAGISGFAGGCKPVRRFSNSDRPDSKERTGIQFEKERVSGYSGGEGAARQRPLAPAIAPIRG